MAQREHYRLRKIWGRITPLANYVAMTIQPVKEAWIHHTVTAMSAAYFNALKKERSATSKSERRRWRRIAVKMEKAHMRFLEEIAIGRGFDGVSYTDVVFPSGRVYVGRGFQKVGAHTYGRNSVSYGIVVVGNFETEKPTGRALKGVAFTIRKGKRWHRISKTVKIDGHYRAPGASTACPGRNLKAELDTIRRLAA
jgi:hypothetical protein